MPIAILSLLAALTAGYVAISAPAETSRNQWVNADVQATNLIAYRAAVISYLNTNPSATGTIADGSLTFLPGYVRNPVWTNLISSGTLYTYSTTVAAPGVADQVWRYSQQSLMVGTKSSAGGLVVPGSGSNSIVLPAAIPTGAIVMVGQ